MLFGCNMILFKKYVIFYIYGRFRGRGGRFRRFRGGRRGGGFYRERRDIEEDRGEYVENGEEFGDDKFR